MTGTDCGLFTHKSVPVIFEPPCISVEIPVRCYMLRFVAVYFINVALVLILIFFGCFVLIPT